jgi:acyl carrier protein
VIHGSVFLKSSGQIRSWRPKIPHDPETIRKAAREAIAEVSRRTVLDDQCVVSTGIIDSLSVLNLIALLEKKLQIRIPTSQVQPEDFDSVEIILETLRRIVP